ncbi:hypothetical protein MWU65_02135 [Cellulophaga sp. F20128]|uniref:hypothetical protein n=1 Tax=Cellulophaga sp. F20128 TaxID=2926413 RepID=UPI001FF6B3A4|nr:hypothetical protein [Cellulophaga sp. F20128]MCK0155960.1 hypothetical protein [Cellulophaga sp. F20128]
MEEELKNRKIDKKKAIKTLQFFAAYLVAAWTLLQFVDWVLIRYSISPYWVDLLLWIFSGIIPSLLIYLYHQDRINNRILKLREKIIFPLNILFIMVVTYFGFGNSDLGATTKTIAYTNAEGKEETTLITKEEFRTSFPIFNFKPITKDSTHVWLEFGISILLQEDLLQNKNISPEVKGITNTVDKVDYAKIFNDFYIDGEFDINDDTYTITMFIRNARNGKVTNQQTFEGKNILSLVDEMTVFVTANFTSNELNAPQYMDLDVEEFTSSSLKALAYYRNGDFENAIKEDSTFALAYLASAKVNLLFNKSKFEERTLADHAYNYSDKLPLQKRGETLIFKNLAYDQFNNAETLIKLQLEVDPSDKTYSRLLYSIYGRTQNLRDYTELAYNNYKSEPSTTHGLQLIHPGIINEDYKMVLDELNRLELLLLNDNNIFPLKIQPQLFKGDLEAAEKNLSKMDLLFPKTGNLTKVFKKAVTYLKGHKVTRADLKKFEGEYRFNGNEQTVKLWVENNTLLQYVSNQNITPFLMAGANTIVAGSPNNSRTWEITFSKDERNKYYRYKNEQNDFDNSTVFYYWKLDNTIKKAEALFDEKKLDGAKIAYTEAIKANPKHYYLKDVLEHINYIQSIDSVALQNQLNDVVGTYGPRIFWMEESKLFYKREQAENGQVFPKIEILPISKDRYINRTNFSTIYAFEFENGKSKYSFPYQYLMEKEAWIKSELEENTFVKDL